MSDYSYNNQVIFKYSINLKNSIVLLTIYYENSNKNHFNRIVLGSFVYQTALKFSVSTILVNGDSKSDLESLVFGFLQKDFIYSIYKNNSKKSKFKTNFKLSKNYLSLLNSINFLKELVSEPSNIIYPSSFVKRTLKQFY